MSVKANGLSYSNGKWQQSITVAITEKVNFTAFHHLIPSVLWRSWLGGRKGIRPIKLSGGVLAWLSVWSEVHAACLHMAQLMSLPLTVSCFSKIQIGFSLSGTGSPGKRTVKRVYTHHNELETVTARRTGHDAQMPCNVSDQRSHHSSLPTRRRLTVTLSLTGRYTARRPTVRIV